MSVSYATSLVNNWFILAAGTLYVAGAVVEIGSGRWLLATVFACYAVANFVLAVI